MEWISVKDKLPDVKKKSDFIRESEMLEVKISETKIIMGWYSYSYEFKCYEWVNSQGELIYPTHWMPLPEPPKQ